MLSSNYYVNSSAMHNMIFAKNRTKIPLLLDYSKSNAVF